MGKQNGLNIDQNHQRQTHVCRNLEPLGLDLHKVSNVNLATKMLKRYLYHLVLIDFDTVRKEIFKLCSIIRSSRIHTIVIVWMVKPRIFIEEQLFDRGIDDVIVGKQASARVLAKRVQVHLLNNSLLRHQTNTVRLRETIVDFGAREVWCNGTTCRLPGILADLLKYFVDNPNRVISRAELQATPIWADSICTPAEEGGKTYDVNVGKLRKIIEPYPSNPQIIVSVRGIGWKLIM
jgi:two-component system OmpR family response regulator